MKVKHKDFIPKFTMIGPVIIWLILFIAAPLLYVLYISFMQRGTYGGIVYKFTLDNYIRTMDPLYFNVFLKTLELALVTTLATILLGYPFAYALAHAKGRKKILLMVLLMVPFWTNSIIRTYGWIILLRTEGVINHFLLSLHIISHPLTLIYTDFATILGMIYTLFPFMVLPLFTSIEKLDKTLLEAAADLGAKPRKAFLKVTLPLTMPGVFAGSLMVFIPALGIFYIPDLMGGGKSILMGNLIKNQFLTARDWPFGAALSMVLIILTLILIFSYSRVGDLEEIGGR